MHVVEIRRDSDDLAGPMGRMRDWLDAHEIEPRFFGFDVRVFRHANKPLPPIDIHADGPGSHHNSLVAIAAFIHDVNSQTPVAGESSSAIEIADETMEIEPPADKAQPKERGAEDSVDPYETILGDDVKGK